MTVFQKYFVFIILILPFTQLRFGIIGVGEIILIILFLSKLRKPMYNIHKKDFVFSKFWTYYIILIFFGFLYNEFFLRVKTGTINSMFFDFSSYSLILITCITFENYNERNSIDYKKLFKAIFLSSGIIFTILYVVSLRYSSILGLSLRYYGRFVPLSINLHQVAMSMSPLPFIGIFVIEGEKNKTKKILYLLLVIMLFIMTIETGSFKAFAGLIVGLVFYVFLKFMHLFNKKNRYIFYFIILFLTLLFCFINFEVISNVLSVMFEEEDRGGSRSSLYSEGFNLGLSSLFGRGPGAHVLYNSIYYDAHNSLLSVFIQSGVLGVLVFLLFLVRLIKKIYISPALFSALIPIIFYILGGDVLRRLPIWIFIMLFYYYAKEQGRIKN